MNNVGRGNRISTRSQLVELVTLICFTASAQHAAVNYPQGPIMSYTPTMSLAGYAPLPSAQDGAGETDFIMNFCCHRRFRRASTFESNDAVDELLTKALETHAVALGRIKTLMDRYPLSALKQAYDAFEHDIGSVEPRLFRSIGSTSGVTE